MLVQSRSLYGRYVFTTFWGPVLGVMMKQVCRHSKRSEAHRGLPEARSRIRTVEAPLCGHVSSQFFEPHFRGRDEAVFGCKKSIYYQMSQHEQQVTSTSINLNNFQTLHQKAVPNETYTPVTRSTWEKVNVKRDPTVKIGCTHWERGSRVGMITAFYS